MNFLVSGSNGDIAISVINIISKEFPNSKIIATDSKRPKKIFKNVKYLLFPHCRKKSYFQSLKKLIKLYKINLFIPTVAEEIIFLSDKQDETLSKKILINDSEIVNTFSNKLKTSNWFKVNKFPWLKTTKIQDCNSNDLPVVIKPNFGSGSKQIYYCKDKESLELLKALLNNDFISQKMLNVNSKEYTISILKIQGKSKYCIMERELFGGISFQIKAIKNRTLDAFTVKVTNLLPEFCFINIQAKIHLNKVFCFEINPRLSSSILMRSLIGFKDLTQLIKYKLNYQTDLEFKINYKALVNRRFDCFIIN